VGFMSTTSLFGAYLRARRELVQPEEVGLSRQPRRRVSGLRREELAMLAGISGDYYLRLEQGKDLHPSSLSPNFTPGTNLLLAAFLDPADSELYLDWDQVAEEVVAGIRPLAGDELTSPRLAEIVDELSVGSDQFRKLWARHDVRPKAGAIRRLNHPQLGRVDLRFEKLDVVGTDGQMLVIYHAEPEGPFEEVLARLGTLVTDGT
jgi:transcriptional regulator with XRE-family HTH domain